MTKKGIACHAGRTLRRWVQRLATGKRATGKWQWITYIGRCLLAFLTVCVEAHMFPCIMLVLDLISRIACISPQAGEWWLQHLLFAAKASQWSVTSAGTAVLASRVRVKLLYRTNCNSRDAVSSKYRWWYIWNLCHLHFPCIRQFSDERSFYLLSHACTLHRLKRAHNHDTRTAHLWCAVTYAYVRLSRKCVLEMKNGCNYFMCSILVATKLHSI